MNMAEIEAITTILPSEDEKRSNPNAEQRQVRRRYSLPLNKRIRLGHEASTVDCVVPEDRTISRFHAFLCWDGVSLTVEERPPQPPCFPRRPANEIHFKGLPVRECCVLPGETFSIGRTHFVFWGDGKSSVSLRPETPAPCWEQFFTRSDLEKIPFNNPMIVLKALEKLPDVLRVATNEQALFRQMLKVLLNALQHVETTGVITVDSTSEHVEIEIQMAKPAMKSQVNDLRASDIANGRSRSEGDNRNTEFNPCRELVYRAVNEKKSILDFWFPDIENKTLDARELTSTRWAICTPFQDGTRDALYAGGWYPHPDAPNDSEAIQELTEYQKVIELIVGLLEVTRHTHKLTRENSLLRQGLPPKLSRLIDDVDRIKELLEPRETDVTVVFCDLRSYSRFVEEEGENLVSGWEKIASALNSISRSITLCDGIVARIQGDAVMGYWGWPDAQKTQAGDAVRAALQIRAEFRSRNNPPRLECGIGLAHGHAVVGRLGTHDLAEIDLYGHVVNIAARLECMTKAFGVDVLITEEVANQLAKIPQSSVEWRTRPLGKVRTKGMRNRVVVYELLPAGIPESKESVLASWAQAIDWFSAGCWKEAYERLEDYFRDDSAAKCLMRVMDRHERRPPHSWDGSFTPLPQVEDPDLC